MDLSDDRSASNRGRGAGEVFKGVGSCRELCSIVCYIIYIYHMCFVVCVCIYIYLYLYLDLYLYLYLDIQTIFLGFRVSWGLAYPIS